MCTVEMVLVVQCLGDEGFESAKHFSRQRSSCGSHKGTNNESRDDRVCVHV